MRYGLTGLPNDPAPSPLLSLAEAKLHLRVDHDAEDALIEAQVLAAARMAEQYTRRAFVARSFAMTLEAFPGSAWVGAYAAQDGDVWPPRFGSLTTADRFPAAIVLPLGPLLSVTSITYMSLDLDAEGQPTSKTITGYQASNSSWPPRILPRYSECWPCVAAVPEAVRIEFVAGYGEPAAVPQDIKAGVKLILGSLHEHREDQVMGTVNELPQGAKALLSPYRIFRL